MDILDLGSPSNSESSKSSSSKKSKKLKAAIGIGGLATLTGVGSTLAAQLTLNNNANVEFGQGVAQTAACDNADHGGGFTISPKTEYFNNGDHVFHLTRLQIDGLNLTPQGENYGSAGYGSRSDALADHPGEYFDTETAGWLPTCDGVVLNFSLYTDNPDYLTLTRGFTTESPLYFLDTNAYGAGARYITNIAFKFDANDGNSYKVMSDDTANGYIPGFSYYWNFDYDSVATQNSTVYFTFDSGYGVDAAAVSRITVETMPNFPEYYLTRWDDTF